MKARCSERSICAYYIYCSTGDEQIHIKRRTKTASVTFTRLTCNEDTTRPWPPLKNVYFFPTRARLVLIVFMPRCTAIYEIQGNLVKFINWRTIWTKFVPQQVSLVRFLEFSLLTFLSKLTIDPMSIFTIMFLRPYMMLYIYIYIYVRGFRDVIPIYRKQ